MLCHIVILITVYSGDELNIRFYNDQYHLGCTTTALQLLEVKDSFNQSCEQGDDANPHVHLVYVTANYVFGMVVLPF